MSPPAPSPRGVRGCGPPRPRRGGRAGGEVSEGGAAVVACHGDRPSCRTTRSRLSAVTVALDHENGRVMGRVGDSASPLRFGAGTVPLFSGRSLVVQGFFGFRRLGSLCVLIARSPRSWRRFGRTLLVATSRFESPPSCLLYVFRRSAKGFTKGCTSEAWSVGSPGWRAARRRHRATSRSARRSSRPRCAACAQPVVATLLF